MCNRFQNPNEIVTEQISLTVFRLSFIVWVTNAANYLQMQVSLFSFSLCLAFSLSKSQTAECPRVSFREMQSITIGISVICCLVSAHTHTHTYTHTQENIHESCHSAVVVNINRTLKYSKETGKIHYMGGCCFISLFSIHCFFFHE